MIREAIREVVERHDLSTKVAHDVMLELVRGEATPSQIASFATAMRMKGETEQELRGFVIAMRELAIPLRAPEGSVDLCGTGGDGSGSFNISTAASFVVAGAGIPVAKHGNKSISSRCGSADVLSALGLPVDLDREQVERCLSTSGMGFMFAPVFHGSMKNVFGPRREIGVRTFFNILGPMTNPAMVKHQLIGVYDRELSHKMAGVLCSLGSSHVMMAHGNGMDEITNLGETHILDMENGTSLEYSLVPGDFGLDLAEPGDLKGGDPVHNARTLLSVLKGERSPRADVVALNAAAAIYVAGKAASIHDGLDMAQNVLKSGKALAKLREFSDVASAMEKERQQALSIESLRQRRILPEVLCSRASEISSYMSARISETEDGRTALGVLDPEILSRPSVLSVIVLDRILSILSGGLPRLETIPHEHESLPQSIMAPEGVAVIAEYKPRSPSSPPLSVPPDSELAARAYSTSGVAGVSVLVEPNYFSGSPELFSFFRARLTVPMLFKDFVVTNEQITLASGLGADAILLIAKALNPAALDHLVRSCISHKIEPLVEIHDEEDLAKLSRISSFDSVRMIGVNCRDLRTMRTDLGVLADLKPSLPRYKAIIAESGIQAVGDLEKMRFADAVLIGSLFMNAEDLEAQLKAVVQACGSARS